MVYCKQFNRRTLVITIVVIVVQVVLLVRYAVKNDSDNTSSSPKAMTGFEETNQGEDHVFDIGSLPSPGEELTNVAARRSPTNSTKSVNDIQEHQRVRNSAEQHTMEKSPSTNSYKHVLVFGRMTTGSKALAQYLSKRPDFFYVYEPGHMIFTCTALKGNVRNDSRTHLQELQTPLLNFLNDIYHCNFTKHQYFIKEMNKDNSLYRNRARLNDLQRPITEGALTTLCQSKHVISKIVRGNDIATYSDMLQKNNVKVIFLARDPRGMANSRLKKFGIKKNLSLSQKRLVLNEYVRQHCDWLETNYDSIMNGSRWLRKNTILVRYEDMASDRGSIGKLISEFIGLNSQHEDTDESEYDRNDYTVSLTKWVNYFTYDEVTRIQNLCTDRIFDIFGWVKVRKKWTFEKENQTWFRPMPSFLTKEGFFSI
ncbi:carbohydrate sulfotransferase 1-like [Glandiceps talaboti]